MDSKKPAAGIGAARVEENLNFFFYMAALKRCCCVNFNKTWVLFIFLPTLCLAVFSPIEAATKTNILLIHSYHKGFTWTDGIDAAIRTTLEGQKDLEIYSEYLDSKRWSPESVDPLFSMYLASKYTHKPPSVIITSDNNALAFLTRHYKRLFFNIPVVFCGLNNFEPAMLNGFNGQITGVVEKTDPEGTVRLIQRMQPDLGQLVIITGVSPTAKAIKIEAQKALSEFNSTMDIIWWDGFTAASLLQRVEQLTPKDAVLLISYNRDPSGAYFSYEESARMISQRSPAPVYGMWDFYLNTGLVGGSMVYSQDQGKTAADLCFEILKTGSIPAVITTSPNAVLVDYTSMKKKGLDESNLPRDAIALFTPVSFYQTYKIPIWIVFGSMTLLTALVIALSVNIAARRKSEHNYREIFNAGSDAIFIHDAVSGNILDVNNAMTTMYGYEKKQALEMAIENFSSNIAPYDRENARQIIKLALEQGPQTFEWQAKKKDGRLFWVEVNLKVSKIGDKPCIIAVARDITERKKTQEMIVQNEKMLSVGGLAAGMAHEINNPLAGMMQSANIIENRLNPELQLPANEAAAQSAGTSMQAIHAFMTSRDILSMVATIRKSGNRVARIVENMLSFARKSDDIHSFHDPAVLLDDIIDLASTDYDLKNHFDFKTIKIIKEYDKDLPQIPCESSKIQQVVLNILSNGAQAMHEKKEKNGGYEPTFIIRLLKEPDMLRIEIQDNGPGMDTETCKRIFEPFFTTKPVGVGTGLGLSVSYFIVTENHGGGLSVESSPGHGATFFIRLPLKK